MSRKHCNGYHEHTTYPTEPKTQPQLGGTGKKPPVKYTATAAPKPEPKYQNDILKAMMSSAGKYAELVKRYKPYGDNDFHNFEKWLAKQEEEREKRLARLEKDFQKYFKKHSF